MRFLSRQLIRHSGADKVGTQNPEPQRAASGFRVRGFTAPRNDGWWIAAALFLLLALPARADMRVTLEELGHGEWRVVYESAAPLRRIDLGPALDGARQRGWRVATKGVSLVEDDGRDALVPARGAPLERVELVVAAHQNGFAKDYETIAPLGAGAVLFTGHFLPWAEQGRLDATLTVRSRAGVYAFGEKAPAFNGWRSPYRHPAFIYAGPLDIIAKGSAFDPALPEWVVLEAADVLPRLEAWYEAALGPLDAAPDIFLAMGGDEEEARLGYRGDALPGQFMLTLDGGAWAAPDHGARALLLKALAHEAAHLFQSRARPSGDDAPDWIHEGAADALALEALEGSRLITPEEAHVARERARFECERELAGHSLDQAAQAGRWRAVYACGHGLAVAAARAHNEEGSVARFWRDFVAEAQARGGYDLALFLALVETHGGDKAAKAIARFPWTRHARPARELARMAGE